MHASAVDHHRIAPRAPADSSVAALFVHHCDYDRVGVLIPHPEIHLGVRFGPAARHGLEVHALGVRQTVHRKLIRRGQGSVTARLHLGAHEAVLGVPASEIDGGPVALEDLWGQAEAEALIEQLADAADADEAGAILEQAIGERLARAEAPSPRARLALAAAERLPTSPVSAVAAELGVSERHLRRAFRETVGMSPKAFVRVARFRRALRAARAAGRADWASIAGEAGYYDQAHLIAEFRVIAGVTPRELLSELRASLSIG
jgi:AraC-like DNA-binding protein